MKAYYLNKVINARAFKLTLHGCRIFVSLLFRVPKLSKDHSGEGKLEDTDLQGCIQSSVLTDSYNL